MQIPKTYILENDMILYGWFPLGSSGLASLDLGSLDYLALGDHTLILEVTDGQAIGSDSMVLTVENTPPSAYPTPGSQTATAGVDPVVLGGEVSDFDGDTLGYEWQSGGKILGSGSIDAPRGGAFVRARHGPGGT